MLILVINFFFLFISVFYDDLLIQVFGLFLLGVAASESAIVLILLVVFYNYNKELTFYG